MNVNRLTQINLNLKKVAAHSQCNRFDTQKANRSVQEAIRILNNAFLYRAWNPQKDRKFLTDIKHSIETIKSNQNDFLQHSQLAFLEEKVNMVFQFGMIKTTFNAQALPSSLPEKLIGPFIIFLTF